MSEYKGDIIPINRALIRQLGIVLDGLKNCSIRPDKEFNAILVTREGFMRQEKVKGRMPVLHVPIFQPMTSTLGESAVAIPSHPVMEFCLDRYKSTADCLVYSEAR